MKRYLVRQGWEKVECPSCHAPAGLPCRAIGGATTSTHRPRINVAMGWDEPKEIDVRRVHEQSVPCPRCRAKVGDPCWTRNKTAASKVHGLRRASADFEKNRKES